MEIIMSEESKRCPKCHIINSPSAKSCECGYNFSEGGALSDAELDEIIKKKKQNRSLGSAAVVTLIIIAFLLGIKFGVIYVVAALIVTGVLFALAMLGFGLKARYDRKHPKE